MCPGRYQGAPRAATAPNTPLQRTCVELKPVLFCIHSGVHGYPTGLFESYPGRYPGRCPGRCPDIHPGRYPDTPEYLGVVVLGLSTGLGPGLGMGSGSGIGMKALKSVLV